MTTLATGALLVVGGFHSVDSLGNGPVQSCDAFDPKTRMWTNVSMLPNGRVDFAIAPTDDGRYMFAGGGSPRPDLLSLTDGIRRSMASGPSSAGTTATPLDSGLVLVVGGTEAGLFSAKADEFTPTGALTDGRTFHTATTLGSGKVLFVGGQGTTEPLASAELYDPDKNVFTPTGSMKHARASHVAVALADGRVFVAGGGDPSAEIYDPKTGKFTVADAMSSDRLAARALLLESGHVLVAGGTTTADAATALDTVDVFDPATLTFASVAPLAVPRSSFTAALLETGEAIVIGGKDARDLSLGSVEVWKPGAPGTECAVKDGCSTGVCQAGICCAEASCTGACQTCAPGSGACVAVTLADDLDSCTGDQTCNADGKCTKKNGQTCAKKAECASELCVDGYCCDSECSGQCQACDVAAKPGTCSAVIGESHGPRERCLAFGEPCGGACNGIGTTECAFPSAVTACDATCDAAKLTESTCDGLGACTADAPHACAGNFACADAATCKTECTVDEDCADEFHCDGTKCVPSAVCDGHVVRKGGKSTDCTPYTCEQSGVCKDSCSVVSDCTAPNVCSLDGQCVAPLPTPDTSGCKFRGNSQTGSPQLAVLVALGALTTLRRRRRASQRRSL